MLLLQKTYFTFFKYRFSVLGLSDENNKNSIIPIRNKKVADNCITSIFNILNMISNSNLAIF